MRWLYNCKAKANDEGELSRVSDPAYWETPSFIQIRKKKTKRLSPYSETEIWDPEELLSIVKYERYRRNKAALTLQNDGNDILHTLQSPTPDYPPICYYCDYKPDSREHYERHVILGHDHCLAYPNKAEIEKRGLKPQGKEWER
jgi:hypothetical protein